MTEPATITFQGLDHSDAIEARVRERISRLEAMSPDIHRVTVWIRAPHDKHKATEYIIDIAVEMPGKTESITRHPGNDHAHTDIGVAIRDSFLAMERKLRKWADTHKGRPERHVEPLQGRVESLNGYLGDGQIATTDGRLIYFHRNAVEGDAFDALEVGDTVELSVDMKDADKGPHASFVRRIGSMRFTDKPR